MHQPIKRRQPSITQNDDGDVLNDVNIRNKYVRISLAVLAGGVCYIFKTNLVISATSPPVVSLYCPNRARNLLTKSTDSYFSLFFISFTFHEQSDICLEKIRYVFFLFWEFVKRNNVWNAAHMFESVSSERENLRTNDDFDLCICFSLVKNPLDVVAHASPLNWMFEIRRLHKIDSTLYARVRVAT